LGCFLATFTPSWRQIPLHPFPVILSNGFLEQTGHPTIPIATIFTRQNHDLFSLLFFIFRLMFFLSMGSTRLSNRPAGSSLRNVQHFSRSLDRFPPPVRADYFFDSTSFKIALSRERIIMPAQLRDMYH
jgi:hypothetical protein